MRLQSFHVQGYKNLRLPLDLEELDSFNVIHGDNNVGKSNVLEAIEWFFTLLGACACEHEPHGLQSGIDGPSFRHRLAEHPEPLLGNRRSTGGARSLL